MSAHGTSQIKIKIIHEIKVRIPAWWGRGILSSPKCPDRLWGPHNPLFQGWRIFPRVKRSGCEGGRLLPSKAEVTNVWKPYLRPPIRLHGAQRNNFTCLDVHLIDTKVFRSEEPGLKSQPWNQPRNFMVFFGQDLRRNGMPNYAMAFFPRTDQFIINH